MTNKQDWTLLAIAAADEKGMSPVHLQKTLFLLGREMPHEVGGLFYHFKPYHYGPFDRAIYEDAEQLAREGFVEINQRPGENWNRYSITEDGRKQADFVKRHASPGAVEYLERIVEWATRQNFQQLVTAIYEKYPEMRANSVFQS